AIALVYPTATIQIDNPVAVVDASVDKHGTRAEAEGFLNFLWTPDAQHVFAAHGFRPVNKEVSAEPPILKEFPAVKNLFTITDLGGWESADPALFGKDGSVTQLLAGIKG
ncbi:MAG TPA: substrate-binding domain-containing protein, partial [Aggregatilineaceae bacterium]|nr:substrate-binding domain-containing protein [Aggregatilineaceae bacterium]